MTNSPGGDVFDVRKIRRLIELMKEHDLNEVDLRDGDVRVRLRKGGETIVADTRPYMTAPVAAAPAAPAAAAPAVAADNHLVIKSPMVGTFYRSPSPGAEAFVQIGQAVKEGDTLCIIEAMKLFNEIESEIKGKIVKVLVDDASPVEYDQPLFLVEPA